jgi:hypothetical protein
MDGDRNMQDSAAGQLIARQYRLAHGAVIQPCFGHLATREVRGRVAAALGYRRAAREGLFLETYLDQPIEAMLSSLFSRTITRHDIVEIGNLASDNATAMVALWADAANDLGGDAEIAVAVLTAPLRAMFRRLGLTLHEIAPADPARLGDEAAQWGGYYQLDPMICAGFISEGQQKLARIAARRARAA